METIKKIFDVMMKNAAYSITLLIAICLFAIFSDGLISGLITAASAFIIFVCITLLYKEFKKPAAKVAHKPSTKNTAKSNSKKKK